MITIKALIRTAECLVCMIRINKNAILRKKLKMRGRMKSLLRIVAITAILPALAGCMFFKSENNVNLTLRIIHDRSTNNGKGFYVVARPDTKEEFDKATCKSIYDRFFEEDFGTNIFINPTKKKTVTKLKISRDQAVSVYFLFTSAKAAGWKYRISEVKHNCSYDFILGSSSLEKVVSEPGL